MVDTGTVPAVRYVETAKGSLAYQVFGAGPPDLFVCRSGLGHVELMWDQPKIAQLLRRLAGFSRVLVLDNLGFGLSDPAPLSEIGNWEYVIDEVEAVREAAGFDPGPSVGFGSATTGALLHAATKPDHVTSVVLVDGMAKLTPAVDYPWGLPDEVRLAMLRAGPEEREAIWVALTGEPGWVGRYYRASASPMVWRAVLERLPDFDVRNALDAVHVPTLCLATADEDSVVGASADLAGRIAGAELRVIDAGPRSSLDLLFDRPDVLADEIQRFVTGAVPPSAGNRVLAAVLFTDIVDSTKLAARVGDAAWRSHLDSLDDVVSAEARGFGGKVIKSTGDGHLLTFDGPSRAISCGQAIGRVAASRLSLDMRMGIHVGEIERRGDDIAGLAVSIARRICDLAETGQLLVSHAVPSLVVGGSASFVERGVRELKGVPGEWMIHEVAP